MRGLCRLSVTAAEAAQDCADDIDSAEFDDALVDLYDTPVRACVSHCMPFMTEWS